MPSPTGKVAADVHPGLELLGAADLLAGGSFELPDLEFARALAKDLAPFKSHPAVALNAALNAGDRDRARRKDALLKRGAPPALSPRDEMAANLGEDDRTGALTPWLEAMRDFAKASRFPGLLEKHDALIRPFVRELEAKAAAAGHAAAMEEYAGLPFDGLYRLWPSPLCQDGGVLNRVWSAGDGTPEVHSVIKPDQDRTRRTCLTPEDLDAVVWHELGHALLDETVHLYDHEMKDKPLDLGKDLSKNCRDWLHGMREHLVRSVMLRLLALKRGEKDAARQFEEEDLGRAPHLKAFVAALKDYEKSRAEFPTLADFYPRLRELLPGRERPANAGESRAPFDTPGQRARAVKRLDALAKRSKDPVLAKRRAALTAAGL